MYCWNCGHKNPDDNKFCGACGKMQVRPPVFVESEMIDDSIKTVPAGPSQPARNERRTSDIAQSLDVKKVEAADQAIVMEKSPKAVEPPPGTGIIPSVTPTRRYTSTNSLIGETRALKELPLPSSNPTVAPPRISPSEPMRISGPSFLGLSDGPAESSDYLLAEDEDAAQSSTARSYVFLALLLLFGVLIYKQWDTVSAIAHDLGRGTSATTSSSAPDRDTKNAEAQKPSPESATSEIAADTTAAANKPESDHAAADDSAAKEPAIDEKNSTGKETPRPPAKPETSDKQLAAKSHESDGARTDSEAVPVVDDSRVDLAQKYLQGRGVAQDCNRGVSLLRSAAAQPNPKAQIKLGALYATGYCVSQDKAEAYRWFAEARQLQPGNQWIDKNLNSLWSEMSAQERARVQR